MPSQHITTTEPGTQSGKQRLVKAAVKPVLFAPSTIQQSTCVCHVESRTGGAQSRGGGASPSPYIPKRREERERETNTNTGVGDDARGFSPKPLERKKDQQPTEGSRIPGQASSWGGSAPMPPRKKERSRRMQAAASTYLSRMSWLRRTQLAAGQSPSTTSSPKQNREPLQIHNPQEPVPRADTCLHSRPCGSQGHDQRGKKRREVKRPKQGSLEDPFGRPDT